jgi:hydroxymethylbilane synthase
MRVQNKMKIGTRGSDLAVAQTNQVVAALRKAFPSVTVEIVVLKTRGDKILDKPLPEFGGKGAFVTEFEEELLAGSIDLAVHSAKDMPVELAKGLALAGVLKREDARDVLVTRKGEEKNRTGKKGFVIGTGSLRRQSQIQMIYPEAEYRGIRGNVPTRLRKLREKEYDAVVLAAAGLKRLGLLEEADLEYRYFSFDEVIPAGGQAVIAIEGRKEDAFTEMVRQISDGTAFAELMMEREILQMLDAGCHEAVGVLAQYTEDSVRIRLMKEIGEIVRRVEQTAEAELGCQLAKELVLRLNGEAARKL